MAGSTARGAHGVERFWSRDPAHRDGGSDARHGARFFQNAISKYKIVLNDTQN